MFIVPLKVGERLVKWGVPREKIVELDWWDEFHLDARLKIAATPAQHFSGRGLTDRNKTLWASWIVSGPVHNIFFSGDSGYFEGFKQIGRKYGPFDMTLILPGFGKKLKKPNGTDAGRAFFRCIFTLMNIAAVAAAPDPFLVPVEYPAGFEVVCKGQKCFFMLLFRN